MLLFWKDYNLKKPKLNTCFKKRYWDFFFFRNNLIETAYT